MNIAPSSHREIVDLPDPPRITLPKTARIEAARARQEQPLSLEGELAATRALRERCEALLVELGCPVEVSSDSPRSAA